MCNAAILLCINLLFVSVLAYLFHDKNGSQTVLLVDMFSFLLMVVGFFIAGETASIFVFFTTVTKTWHLVETIKPTFIGRHTPVGLNAASAVGVAFYLGVKGELASSILLVLGGLLLFTILILYDLDKSAIDAIDKRIEKAETTVLEKAAAELKAQFPESAPLRADGSNPSTVRQSDDKVKNSTVQPATSLSVIKQKPGTKM